MLLASYDFVLDNRKLEEKMYEMTVFLHLLLDKLLSMEISTRMRELSDERVQKYLKKKNRRVLN